MKSFTLSLAAMLVLAAPLLTLADTNPDFEQDAKPILASQPGLVHYVHSHFVVKEVGVARVPGNAGQPPQPPFIFSARPRGVTGPFYLRLLIQPGPEGRILKVADMRKLAPGQPEPGPTPETAEAPAESAASQPIENAPAPASSPDENSSSNSPTSSEHSGPIRD
jgi:hypothetical protein